MYPILARTRWFFVYSYTAVLTLGVLLSIAYIYAPRRRASAPKHLFDGILFTIFGAIVVGRLTFIWSEWAYYAERSEALGQLWQGGLTFHGAWVGGLLGVWLWALWHKQSASTLLETIAPMLPLLVLFGWGACWLEGCAYGAETTFGPFSANLPDQLGVFAVRYQTQLFGMVLTVLIMVGVWWMRQRGWNGRLFLPTTLAIFLSHTIITPLFGEPVQQILFLRLDTFLDITVVSLCFILLQYGKAVSRKL